MMKEEHRPLVEKALEKFKSPFFYYDLDSFRENIKKVKGALDPGITLWYACKANPLSSILEVVEEEGLGVDVASHGELKQVLRAGIPPGRIISTGPAKSKEYLRQLLEESVHAVILESVNQARWLGELAQEKEKKLRVLLRFQLEQRKGGGHEITPFGTDAQGWKEELSVPLGDHLGKHLDILGLHVFQWGNILNMDVLEGIWRLAIEQGKRLAQDMGLPLRVLDLGGGLGIPYSSGEKPLDFSQVNAVLMELKREFQLETIWLELGRFLVGESGFYVAQVIDRKRVYGQDILALEGGINHLARSALMGQSFPCQILRKSQATLQNFALHGPLCTSLDKLGQFDLPGDVGPGDWAIFSQAGAYGLTEAMPFFLCHDLPGEGIIKAGHFEVKRDVQTAVHWLV